MSETNCVKCGGAVSLGAVAHAECPGSRPFERLSLQLLIIDFGDSCVVKVEKSVWDFNDVFYQPNCVYILEERFTALRGRIDALEEKPLPRIERAESGNYAIVTEYSRQEFPLTTLEQMKVLFGGAKVSVYEGKRGEWKQLAGASLLTGVGSFQTGLPCDIWRYTA